MRINGEVRLEFRNPKNNSRVLPLVEPEIDVWVENHAAFAARYVMTSVMCCRLDGIDTGCVGLNSTQIKLEKLELGWHELACGLFENDTPLCSETVSKFQVVAQAIETEDGKRIAELYVLEAERIRPLMQWWRGESTFFPGGLEQFFVAARGPSPPSHHHQQQRYDSDHKIDNKNKSWPWLGRKDMIRLVIGVKCAAQNIAARDAMRKTWLSEAIYGTIAVYFIIGLAKSELQPFLEREQALFHDLLLPSTSTLFENVEDTYVNLVSKTKSFLTFALNEFPTASHFMLTDDDILIDTLRLLEALPTLPITKFYAGQVWAHHFNSPRLPQRDPKHRNYLPPEVYPMSQLPPFAIGPHYILSADCAEFIAKNRNQLASVGTLEDVSVAMWLFAIGVHPQHSDQFVNARLFGCVEHAVSLADLTPIGIIEMHAARTTIKNENSTFFNTHSTMTSSSAAVCDKYDQLKWVKTPRFSLLKEDAVISLDPDGGQSRVPIAPLTTTTLSSDYFKTTTEKMKLQGKYTTENRRKFNKQSK